MKYIRPMVLLLLLAVFELFFVPFPFVFIGLFLYFQFFDQEEALVFAFFIGVVFDILLLRPLGTTALLFLCMLFVTSLYRRKYEASNLLFLGISVFVAIFVLEFLSNKSVALTHALFGMVITIVLAKFLSSQTYESGYRIS